MIALVRYQAAVLVRAHRWVGPLLLYATLLTFVGDKQPLRDGLDWSAAMLVPAIAWLTRSALTAEPDAARACVAVAGGPHRAHLAALAATLGGGLGAAAVCLLVGSAVGTLCNPPVIRHQAIALLSTTGAVVIALVSNVSPANAAIRGSASATVGPAWVTGLPLLVAVALAAVSWLVSTLLAGRRG